MAAPRDGMQLLSADVRERPEVCSCFSKRGLYESTCCLHPARGTRRRKACSTQIARCWLQLIACRLHASPTLTNARPNHAT